MWFEVMLRDTSTWLVNMAQVTKIRPYDGGAVLDMVDGEHVAVRNNYLDLRAALSARAVAI